MPLAQKRKWKALTREERRERRLLRREKQRKDNIGRAAKMHADRLRMKSDEPDKPVAGVPSEWGPSVSRYRYYHTDSGVHFVDPADRRVIYDLN